MPYAARDRDMTLSRAGTCLIVVLAAVTVALMIFAYSLKLAADDLFASLEQARGTTTVVRTGPGMWLADHMAADVPEADLVARRARADQLGTRSDRLREAAGAVGVLGILLAVLTGTGDAEGDRERETSKPAAKTTRIGTA